MDNMQRNQNQHRDVRRDESGNLISSEKVDGTKVYASDGDQVGKVHHFMVGKRSGQVEYAVMSCGGFLGMGAEYRPVPWDALDYDTDKGGYVIGTDKNRLSDAPSYEQDREPSWDNDYNRSVHNHYGTTY